jgi:SAM-dependent methyltransferase
VRSLPAEFFKRIDEAPDELFYASARPETHLDAHASQALAAWYGELLPPQGRVLDLLAGAHSHLPAREQAVVGLGLDTAALSVNRALAEFVLHDVNTTPKLPFESGTFAAVVCSVSVQYLTQPLQVFQEVARVLQPGGRFLVAFSNRMFPSKAVLCWRVSDDAAHGRLIRSYFEASGRFAAVQSRSRVAPEPQGAPVYLLWADVASSAADSANSS